MKSKRFPASQARIDFAELLNRVAFGAERIVLHRHDKDIAALVPLSDLESLDQAASASTEVIAAQAQEGLYKLAAIVESSNDAIIGKTLEGVITSWNPGAERLYGYSAAEVIGKPISVLIPANRPNEVPQFLEQIRRGEQVSHFETVRVRKDGRLIDVSLTISPIKDARGTIMGASTIARDITERKQAEAELRDSREQLRALSARLQTLQEEERDRLAREIQGQFGQTLTALKLDLAWLSKRMAGKRSALKKKLETMVQLLDSTIQGMRKISAQLRPRALDELGLAAAIEWEVNEFQQRAGVECQLTNIPEEIMLDTAHSIAVFRILQEILKNLANTTSSAAIEFIINDDARRLILEVVAHGIKQTDFTALDLVFIRERALLFGGTVHIDNKNNDAVIRIEMPIPGHAAVTNANAPANFQQLLESGPKQPLKARRMAKGPAIRVLIADSFAIVREGLKQILSELPNVVVAGEAGNDKEMFAQLRMNSWDILIMDLSLPDKNGLDILKQIKAEFGRLPVLVLSAQAEEQYAVRLLRAGAAGYLNKESAPDQLIEAIEKIAKGGQYINESIAERLLTDLRTDATRPPHKNLSDREFQVLCMIASGKKLIQIARELRLSVKTISTHRSKLLQKMGMTSNVELVHYAIENHLIS